MRNSFASTYREQIAEVFDEWNSDLDQIIIPTLVELFHDGRALGLGINKGRIELPLQRAGIEVHGSDTSQPMPKKLKEKVGSHPQICR